MPTVGVFKICTSAYLMVRCAEFQSVLDKSGTATVVYVAVCGEH